MKLYRVYGLAAGLVSAVAMVIVFMDILTQGSAVFIEPRVWLAWIELAAAATGAFFLILMFVDEMKEND